MDYVTAGLSRLTSEFATKKKIVAFLKAILSEFQLLNTDINAIKTERWISSAVGVQLDGVGYIVGVKRLGRDDDDYRAAIMQWVATQSIIGTPEAIIATLKFLTEADDTQYHEMYPASTMVLTEGWSVDTTTPEALHAVATGGTSDIAVMAAFGSNPLRTALVQEDPAVLAVNGGRLSVNGDSLDVGLSAVSALGSRLSGLVPPRLLVNGRRLSISGEAQLVICNSQFSNVLDSGYHMPGVFQ